MLLIVNRIRLLCLMPTILMVWFSTSVMADVNHLGTWRSEVTADRIQAENNARAAYSKAEHLQSTLPKEATPIDRARLLNLLSRIEVYLARTERAAMHAQQALDLAKQHADKVGQVEAYLNIALNAANQGKLGVLEAAVNASMEVADDVNRPDLLAESMLQTAMLYHQQGRFDDSVTMAIQTMEIARRSNNAIALMLAHQGMALSYDHSGRMKEAQEHYEQMRKQAKAAQMLRLEADAMIGLGRVDNNLGYYSGGEQFTRQAIERYRKTGHPFSLAFGLYSLAESLHRQRNVAASLSVLNEAVAIYEQYPNAIGFWRVLDARSTYSQSLGHADAAIADAERAYAVAKPIGSSLYLTDSAKHLAAIAAGQGDHRRAYALLAEADALSMQADHHGAGTRMLTLAKRYESASKQREVSELNLRNERQAAVLHQQSLQFRWLSTLVIGGFSILFITVFLLLHLRQSNNRLQRFQRHQQAILDAIPDLMFEMGLDGRYYSCHTLRSDLLVAPASSLLGKTVSDVMPKEAAEVCLSALQEAYEKGVSASKVLELPLPQGTSWFELSVARKVTESGEEPRFIGISRDITARKQLELKLNEREREFRSLAENSPDLVARFDRHCRYVYCNSPILKMLGHPQNEVVGRTPVELLDDEVIRRFQATVEEVLRTGHAAELVQIMPSRRARKTYDHVRFTPEYDEFGEVISVLAVGRDISEIKAVERQLLTLLENLPEFVVRLDMQARHLYVSPAVTKAFGLASDHFIGKTIVDIGLTGDMVSDIALMDAALNCAKEGIPIMMEVTFQHASGNRIFDIMYVPERDELGQVVSVLSVARDITDMRTAHNALQEKEALLRSLIDSIPDLIFFKDTDSVFLGLNKACAEFCGYGEAELIGKTDHYFASKEVADEFQRHDREMIVSGITHHNDEWVTFPDGRKALLNTMKTPLRDANGKVIGVIGVSRDITERYRMELELMQREREFRTLAEHAPDNIARYDHETRIVYVNPVLQRTHGWREGDGIGKRMDELFPHNDAVLRYQKALEQVVASGLPATFELVSEPIGGERALYDLIRLAPEFDESGHVIGVIGIGRDISESKRMEQALIQREYEFRTLAENSPSVIVRYDLDCRRTYVNSTYLKVNPHAVDVVLGATPLEFWNVLSMTAEEYIEHLRNIMATGKPEELMIELLDKDGLLAYHSISLVPEFNESGQVMSVLSICHDVTYIKRIEAMLRNSEREFRTLAENSPDNIARYDSQCRIRYINPQLEKTMGVDSHALLGLASNDADYPIVGNYGEYDVKVASVLRTGQDDEYELTLPDTGAGQRYHHVRFVAERDEGGNVIGVLAIGRDVTEHRRVERLLLNLSNGIHGLLGAYRQRPDGSAHQLFASPGLYDIFGVTFDEIKDDSTPRLKRIHPDDLATSLAIMEEAVCTMSPAWNEVRVNHPVKGEIWVETYATPVREDDGGIIWYGYSAEVTERHRLQDALKMREQEFRTLAENAPDCIARYDSEMRTVYINPALELALELSMTEVIGKRVDEIFPHYEPMVRYQAVLEQVIASGKPATFEMESKSDGEGHVFYDLIRFAPELDAEGHVVGVIAIGHDYSEQKRLSLELMRREHEFRTLAENSPSVIVRYDLDCRRTYVNRAYLDAIPHSDDAVLGVTPMEFWQLRVPTAEDYMRYLQSVIATGEPIEFMVEHLAKDGLMAYRMMSLVPEFDAQRQVMSVLSISHDITYIKRIEAMLRKSEQEFRTLAENSPEMIVRYDHDCRRVYINPAYEKQTGIPIKDAWNKTPDDVWKPDLRREEYVRRIQQVMNTGEPDQILLEWRGADGEMVSHQMHAVAEYDEYGVAVGVLVIGHNITKLKLTERQLEESQQLLRQLAARSEVVREDERKSLAREVHDELGQYLMAIRMNVTACGLEFGVNSPALKKEVTQLIALVDATISVVRNVVVLLRPHALDMGIVPALEWLVDEYQVRTGTLCEMHIEDNSIYLDDKRATAVFRIVQESLTNIGRHAKASKIDIVFEKIDSWYALQVRDNGVGFDAKKRKEKSFGLVGIRERVLMLGGELEITSAIGHGTVIKVRIPVNDVRSEEE